MNLRETTIFYHIHRRIIFLYFCGCQKIYFPCNFVLPSFLHGSLASWLPTHLWQESFPSNYSIKTFKNWRLKLLKFRAYSPKKRCIAKYLSIYIYLSIYLSIPSSYLHTHPLIFISHSLPHLLPKFFLSSVKLKLYPPK